MAFMTKKKANTISYDEFEEAMRRMVKEVVEELRKLLASKNDISDFGDRVIVRLDSIDRHFLELRAEMRNIRVMYEFWADRHLSPDLMEEFLKEQEKKRKTVVKRMD